MGEISAGQAAELDRALCGVASLLLDQCEIMERNLRRRQPAVIPLPSACYVSEYGFTVHVKDACKCGAQVPGR